MVANEDLERARTYLNQAPGLMALHPLRMMRCKTSGENTFRIHLLTLGDRAE